MLTPDRPFLNKQDKEDIQGLVIYGTSLPLLRYHFFEVKNADAARGFIGSFVSDGDLHVSSAAAPDAGRRDKGGHRIYVALTSLGLQALEQPEESVKSFPEEFRQGAVTRASEVGDTGASAPEHWTFPHNRVHIAVMVYARTSEELESLSKAILERAAAQGCSDVARLDGKALEDVTHSSGQTLKRPLVHFNFTDGISQPSLMGARLDRPLDAKARPPQVPPGMFVLGHRYRPDIPLMEPNFSIANEPLPEPEALGYNGTFGALRVLEQDCDAFEDFLDRNSDPEDPLSRELLAAKMCGRWRNGRPLTLFPNDPGSAPPGPQESLNDFDYCKIKDRQDVIDDPKGALCPIGSHVRRANPRSAEVLGRMGNRVRLIRRGMPYGPPHVRRDGKKRGMLGLFLCASLKHQFEFVQKHWINDGLFAKGLQPGDTDPMVGNQADQARFTYPNGDGTTTKAIGLTQFVKTTGAAYLFFPSLPALRFLSGVASAATSERSPVAGAELAVSEQDRVDSVVANMLRRVGRGTRRDAHPKHHGVVRASFEILRDVPDDLAYGLFAKPDRFHAYIRFSNGSPKPMPGGSLQHDSIPDVRGMSIKLLGVPGQKLVDDEKGTHDFVLASHPVFFTRDLGAYLGFLDTPSQHLERKFPLLFASFKTHKNPLTIEYFSQTPYRLGPEHVVKYVVVPVVADARELKPIELSPLDPQSAQPNFLRDAMAAHLAAHEAVFDFNVQLRPQAANVDDATEEWTTERRTVARITISVQEFRNVRQDIFAENMSFSPWHCLEAHRPLGSINMTRRTVYRLASAARHQNGGIPPREPDGTNDF